jgi:hypothetical protein
MSWEQAILLRAWEATSTERSDTPFTKNRRAMRQRSSHASR